MGGAGDLLDGISCPSSDFCIAAGDDGRLYWSADPANDAPTWDSALLDTTYGLGAVSCASASMCVATDTSGHVLPSTNPMGDARSWTSHDIDFPQVLNDISCPSPRLCATVDAGGYAIASSIPTAGASAWKREHIDREWSLTGVACLSNPLCVAVDNGGRAFIGTEAPPGTLITGETIDSRHGTATFSFRAAGGGAVSVARCRLQRGQRAARFRGCGSPKTYAHLKRGRYVFAVRAVSRAGPDPTPATRRFRIRR
jgi:hypothetical protein